MRSRRTIEARSTAERRIGGEDHVIGEDSGLRKVVSLHDPPSKTSLVPRRSAADPTGDIDGVDVGKVADKKRLQRGESTV